MLYICFSTKRLCDLATIILKNNFEMGEEVYHQLLGTAIRTKFAPTYANSFMAGLEKKIFENANFKSHLWFRYLEDIFCVWAKGLERLQEFYQYHNSFNPTIKFTMEFSKMQINFLDVNISQKESALQTDLYCKSTDTYQFIHFRSCHCYVYKKSIPYGQAIRLCSNEEKLSSRLEDLEHWFCSRGYKKEMVHSEIQKLHSMNRENLLKKREEQDKNDSLTLVLTYHPALNKVHEILKKAHRHTIR